MKVKHSKFRNPGIIYELLVRQVATDTLSNKESKAVDILKRYFTKGELCNEQKIYNILYSAKIINESKAETLISSALDVAKKLNQSVLRREKYNLIKEIKNVYNIDDFFKTKIPDYKIFASIYNLIETISNKKFTDPQIVVSNKETLLEHITNKKTEKTFDNEVLEEYSKIDKDTRILSYKLMVEKFNEKYGDLDSNQKMLLKEYINSNNINDLKDYVNTKHDYIKKELTKLIKKVDDSVTNIKLTEMLNMIQPIEKSVRDEDIVELMQYFQLLNELKSTQK
jgi:hypothetical protein